MSKNTDIENDLSFPENKLDYEYYCNVQLMRDIKLEYNTISKCLLADTIDNSPINKLEPINTLYSKNEIYDQYKRLSDDFNLYIDKIIEKNDINDYNDYQKTMDMLMIIACDTAEFVHKNLIFNANKKFLKQKNIYMNKKKSIKYIASQIGIIVYMLKSNTLAPIIVNYFSTSFFWAIIIILFLIAVFSKSIIFSIMTLGIIAIYSKLSSNLSRAERSAEYQLSKYKYNVHPYNLRLKFNNIMEILSTIKELISRKE